VAPLETPGSSRRSGRRWLRAVAWLAAWISLGGCAATRFENYPLAQGQVNAERRVLDVSDKQRPFILVAISGGGSRAADLGWVVLRELRNIRYAQGARGGSLADDVAVVSSVSGGSVIAAHFALYGPDGLDRFEPDFLVPDNMQTLGMDAANPITWLQLAITGASRIDAVEQLFDAQLFKNRTFADLNQRGRPYLILNATDMASGEVFAFTPRRFDDICSDLDREPISAGVGASAAVPVALTPVALQNYTVQDCQGRAMPKWIIDDLKGRYEPYVNIEQYKRARYANDLRHGDNAFRKIDYLYLEDGGLADNLAVHGLLETISSPYAAPVTAATGSDGSHTVLEAINTGQIRTLVVIVINARSDPANAIYQSPSRPGIVQMVGSVTSVPIDSTSASVNSQLDELLADLDAAGGGAPNDPQFAGLRVYAVQIDFDQLRADDAAQLDLRNRVKAIPTSWTITQDNRAIVERVGKTLLYQHPCFQRLLLDLGIGAASPGFALDPVFARTGCPQAADRP